MQSTGILWPAHVRTMERISLPCACPCSAAGSTSWHWFMWLYLQAFNFDYPGSVSQFFAITDGRILFTSGLAVLQTPLPKSGMCCQDTTSLHSQLLNPLWKNLPSRQQMDRKERHPTPPQLSRFLSPRSLVALQISFNPAEKPPMWMTGECFHFGQSHSLRARAGEWFALILLLHGNWLLITQSELLNSSLVVPAEPSLLTGINSSS